QAQGLAMADRLLGNSRITILTLSDGGAMEGEAREVFASLPGLAARGLVNPFLLVVSDNNTKLSGRIDLDSFSMAPSFESLSTLGWKHVVVEEGHDLGRLVEVVGSALHELSQGSLRPIVLQVKTIKGFGVQSTVESASGGHGFPLKKKEEILAFLNEIYGGQPIPGPIQKLMQKLMDREQIQTPVKFARINEMPEDKIQLGVSRAMIRAREENIPVVSLSSDLPGSTGVAGFRKAYPRESFDFGVAEANMISAAAGFSRVGLVPVVDTFAQFGVTKGALPFTMAALSMAPIVAVFSHAGFQDAADGASHQALGYVAMMSSIPHVQVHSLSCAEEAESLIYQALRNFYELRSSGRVPDSHVFFLGRENFPIRYAESMTYQLGKAHVFLDTSKKFSKSVCLVASGSLVREALEAARELEVRGFGSVVVHPSSIKPLDLESIKKSILSCSGRVVVVEDHQKTGGLAQILLASLSLDSFQVQARSLGVDQKFGQSAYEALHLYQKHGMDRESILTSALDLLDP
ncbi:MAG: transketolase C-terminal domain-containing protein, partial [Bdellovibrio sp.]